MLTTGQRHRLAAPVVAVYWLVLLVGLGVYTADLTGEPHAALAPLWVGAIVGTALGQFLAVRDVRLWLSVMIIAVATYFTMPMASITLGVFSTWKAFIPAALCGYWSLSDRGALVAFWFPTVVWMLPILERTGINPSGGTLAPDASGLGLLGVLVIGFVLFLRTRESRRVALWRAVSAQPLARASAPALLKQAPAHAVARATWTLTVTAITAAITAWLAPHLWQLEPLRGMQVAIPDLTAANLDGDDAPLHLPCCPRRKPIEIDRARVKDYLELGRGQDDTASPVDEPPDVCRKCDEVAIGEGVDGIAVGGVSATPELSPSSPPSTAGVAREVAHDEPPAWHATPVPEVDEVVPPGEPARAPAPASVPAPAPVVTERPPVAAPPPIADPVPAPAPAIVTSPPALPEVSAPPPALPTAARRDAAPSDAHASPPIAHHRAPWWPWLITLAAGALISQIVVLGLRPLRRLVILRHLRRPFWTESIDQRVSNAWQLALIGLHDAGWRPEGGEAPRELAARVGIAGIAECAVILERARHGLGLDAGDLAEILRQADVAYASARSPLGAVARAVGWLRSPLT